MSTILLWPLNRNKKEIHSSLFYVYMCYTCGHVYVRSIWWRSYQTVLVFKKEFIKYCNNATERACLRKYNEWAMHQFGSQNVWHVQLRHTVHTAHRTATTSYGNFVMCHISVYIFNLNAWSRIYFKFQNEVSVGGRRMQFFCVFSMNMLP